MVKTLTRRCHLSKRNATSDSRRRRICGSREHTKHFSVSLLAPPHRYRPQQTRLEQRRIRFERSKIRPCICLRHARLQISNHAVWPQVCYLDRDLVCSRLERLRHVRSEWWLPKNPAHRLPVDFHLSHLLHRAEIEYHLCAGLEPVVRCIELIAVRS